LRGRRGFYCENGVCHSFEGGNPFFSAWTPAFAGVTLAIWLFRNRDYLCQAAVVGGVGAEVVEFAEAVSDVAGVAAVELVKEGGLEVRGVA